MSPAVHAAGAVVWRPDGAGGVEVAVVHRPRYDDWSLPKGHVEPGEARVGAAVREVAEETGYAVRLGRALGRTSYRVRGRDKHVDHWVAAVVGGGFVANDEVDALRWLPVAGAGALLTQASDAAVLARFAALPADCATTLLVRHAKAGRRADHVGDDALRPLVPAGREQAEALVAVGRAFGATAVHAADRVRCVQTVEPLAAALGVPVLLEPSLTDDAWSADPTGTQQRAQDLLGGPGTPVVCSQGGVIPALVGGWARGSGVPPPCLRTRKASTWVLSTHRGRVVAIDHLPDPAR